jgi:hypothetical protein
VDPAVDAEDGGRRDPQGDACVRLLAVSSLDLQLRSDKETRVLTEGFGRLLNALDDSLCVIVRGEPIDLEEAALTAELAGASQDNGARPGGSRSAKEQLCWEAEANRLQRGLFAEVDVSSAAGELGHRTDETRTLTGGTRGRATGGSRPQWSPPAAGRRLILM